MGMGIPVLHGVAGESAEIVQREDCGQVFEPENVDQLVEGLLTLQASPALRENYRTHGLAAAKHYDRNQLALDMLAVLQHAVADPVRVSALPEEGKHEC